MSLQGKRIVVGLGGGIAAFKSVELVRELMRRGADVRVVMTAAATRFVGPITFTGLTGKPAVTDLWAEDYAGEVHVELGEWADAIVVAQPAMSPTRLSPAARARSQRRLCRQPRTAHVAAAPEGIADAEHVACQLAAAQPGLQRELVALDGLAA